MARGDERRRVIEEFDLGSEHDPQGARGVACRPTSPSRPERDGGGEDGGGESEGHESGRTIVEILAKKRSAYTHRERRRPRPHEEGVTGYAFVGIGLRSPRTTPRAPTGATRL